MSAQFLVAQSRSKEVLSRAISKLTDTSSGSKTKMIIPHPNFISFQTKTSSSGQSAFSETPDTSSKFAVVLITTSDNNLNNKTIQNFYYRTCSISTPDQTSVQITNAFIPQKCAPPI